MPTLRPAQLNIRSRYARERVGQLVARTGRTATEVVEDALRAYAPPEEEPAPPGTIRKGWLLVADMGGRVITREQADDAIEASREGDD